MRLTNFVAKDFDNDGFSELAVLVLGSGKYRPGVVRDYLGGLYWYNLADDDTTVEQTQWGLSGHIP